MRAMPGGLFRWSVILAGATVSATTFADTAAARSPVWIPGSTVKVQQLNGETDKERHQPTLSQTFTRYHIRGADLGAPLELQGKTYFFFGDTVGERRRALDSFATTDATDPEKGVRLDFVTLPGLPYAAVEPPGISMGAFEVPLGGIVLDGQAYVAVRTHHAPDWSTDRSVLTRFTPPAGFAPLRTISQAPAGRFLTTDFHADPTTQDVWIWGTAKYRQSDVYLSRVSRQDFASGKGTRYFAGLGADGRPLWTDSEADARPVFRNGTAGDISVIWSRELGLWLMTLDSRDPAPRGTLFTYAPAPWGPWSEPQVIFNARRDGALGKFIHDPGITPDDGLAGPVIGKGQANPQAVHGGAYAPYLVERWARVEGGELWLYYTLSTWNPYVVVLMKSRFQLR